MVNKLYFIVEKTVKENSSKDKYYFGKINLKES